MSIKIVIVLRDGLTPGVAANTAAVLAMSLGAAHPELIGGAIPDGNQRLHAGLTGTPIPILCGQVDTLAKIAVTPPPVRVVGFTMTAARARTYADYALALAAAPTDELEHLGVALIGPSKAVTSLTGDLPLFR